MSPAVRDGLGRGLHDLRLSVIDACNFRCPYCMPADAVPDSHGSDAASRLDFDECETLVRAFVALGVRKLRITGGEPLLRKDLPQLIARLASIDGLHDIALTTNGSLLSKHAQALKHAGLHRITVSLDTLDAAMFEQLSGGRGQLQQVLEGIAAAKEAGFAPIKLNCVLQRGINDGQILPLAAFAREQGAVLRFIEYMDVGTCNGWQRQRVLASKQVRDVLHARWPLQALDAQYAGEVASRYAYADGGGEVGFVSSVTAPFCGDCHRARVSAEGQLYTCLFAADGHDLRPALAQGQAALTEVLSGIWAQRRDQYSQQRSAASGNARHVEMFLIGG